MKFCTRINIKFAIANEKLCGIVAHDRCTFDSGFDGVRRTRSYARHGLTIAIAIALQIDDLEIVDTLVVSDECRAISEE